MTLIAAWVYGGLVVVLVGFQICLAAGAPWGHLANGGLHPGRMPPLWRGLALVQGGLLAAMGWAVMSYAAEKGGAGGGLVWAFRAALALTIATTIANWITPSAPERRLWGPVTLVMLISALIVAFG